MATINVNSIATWLRHSAMGRVILDEAMERECGQCVRIRDRQHDCQECDEQRRVLVVCGVTAEGRAWLDVYGDKRLSVLVRQVTTNGDELAAEERLERSLPLSYKELFWPVNLRATATVLARTEADESAARAMLACIREVQEAGKILAK